MNMSAFIQIIFDCILGYRVRAGEGADIQGSIVRASVVRGSMISSGVLRILQTEDEHSCDLTVFRIFRVLTEYMKGIIVVCRIWAMGLICLRRRLVCGRGLF